MGCGGATAVDRSQQGLIVYGDYFNPDSRTIVAILQIAGIQHEFKVIDHLKNEHKSEAYQKINPTCTIPMITQAGTKVLASGPIILQYLCSTNKKL